MKLTIKKAAVDPIQKMLMNMIKDHEDLKKGFSSDLKDILLRDKHWADLMAACVESKSPLEMKENMEKLSIYEKKKAMTDPHFKELIAYKANLDSIVEQQALNLEALINGESKNKFIRALQRLLFFGKPSPKKSMFFGFLFIILATTGIVGTTVGILLDQGLKEWFATVGPFGIQFMKNLANGQERFMNIASWYVAFELLGARGMSLLRKPIIKIDKTSRTAKKNGIYMIEQNLKHIKNNVEKILRYSEDPKFSTLMLGEHAWATDHISVAAENIDQVADFLEVEFQDVKKVKKLLVLKSL